MFLVQILLPVFDNAERRIAQREFHAVKEELTAKFEGLTAYSRSTADGFWGKGKATKRDEIVIYEVMVPSIRKKWWRKYRAKLEKRFRQDVILIRSQEVEAL